MIKIVIFIMIGAFILYAPRFKNDIDALLISRSIEQIINNHKYVDIISKDTSVKQSGNGEMCMIYVNFVIFLNLNEERFEKFVNDIEKIDYSNIRRWRKGGNPKFYFGKSPLGYQYIVTDGPFNANFDYRCW